MWPLVVTFGMALAASYVLTHAAVHLGRRFRILDYPDKDRKLHARATPRTGGVAICLTLLLGVSVLALCGQAMSSMDPSLQRYTAMLLVSTVLLCGVGLWDDKHGMRARVKLTCQVLAILPFVWWGRSTISANLFGWHLDAAWLSVPLILFWLVSCTNFVNLMDGLDGLAATVGLIVTLAVAVVSWLTQMHEVALVSVVLSGALVGFLLHNWPPARIFMGDSGSLPLGFLVGALALESAAKKTAGLTLAVPFVLLAIPMFDTSMAILRRKLNGRKIGQGDREHIHHCLRDRGLSPTQTLLAIGAMCSLTATAAIVATILNNGWIALGSSTALLAMLVAGRVFGFNELQLLARHLQAIGLFLLEAPRALRARFVVLRLEPSVSEGRLELWHKIITRAQRLSQVEIELVCQHVPTRRELTCLSWLGDEPHPVEGPTWRLVYTVPRENGLVARIEARGVLADSDQPLCFHELAEMMYTLCRLWPVGDDTLRALAGTSRVTEGPQILSPHWSSGRRRALDAPVTHSPVENDAA